MKIIIKKTILIITIIGINFGVNSQNKIESTGNVGIGTTNPSSELDIENTGEVSVHINSTSGSQISSSVLFQTPTGNSLIGQSGTANRLLTTSLIGELIIGNRTGGSIIMSADKQYSDKQFILTEEGNIGIGTIDPGSWKLAVNGQIRAKEIKVETGWSDFVFKSNYLLPTLTEVENHIKEKGHLKDIPSAKEVKENGVFLGEMDAKLLQKIEELTLYTIEQQKEIDILKNEKKYLKRLALDLASLKAEIEKLKNKN